MSQPFISICIPAYKRAEYLRRLLESIVIQSYKDFEVIITDDSSDDSVSSLIQNYAGYFKIIYQKNSKPLGSPENWNESVRLASGKWIKIMHDDDWFTDANSIQCFAGATISNPGSSFIFSAFNEMNLDTKQKKSFAITAIQRKLLKSSPLNLFKKNYIGHPSTTLILKSKDLYFDKCLRWVVDFEFYIRYLSKSNNHFANISKPLINIGINEFQITKEAFRNPEIEISEAIYLYYKLPSNCIRNIFVYDYYWRLMRNLSIKSNSELEKYADSQPVPQFLKSIVKLQSKIPDEVIRKGLFSKIFMGTHYLFNIKIQ